MPSSIDRSAPAQNASLLEVMTTPLTAASDVVCLTISSSSSIEVSSSTFIERPGISQVTSAMPSASVSSLKFLKAKFLEVMCRSLDSLSADAPGSLLPSPLREGGAPSHPLDDGRGAHAAADTQRHQRGLLVGALELVEHGAQNHRAGSAERMAERDRAAIDIDLGIVDVECLNVAQHHRGKGFVEFEQIDVGFLHARSLEQLFGNVHGPRQHHRGLRADIGERADFCPRLQAMLLACLLAAEQHCGGAVDDA